MSDATNNEKRTRKFRTVSKKREEKKPKLLDVAKLDETFNVDSVIGDIEDYFQSSFDNDSGEAFPLPPILKFNKNWTLSVTDLSAQLWCEKQLEFMLETGRKRMTEEMEQGIKRHEELELEDHEVVEVEVETEEDNLGVRMLNSIILLEQLLRDGKCRELWLFYTFGDYTVVGVIDQLTIIGDDETGKRVQIADTKTRRVRREPSVAQKQGGAMQIQVYCIMLEATKNGTVDFERLYQAYRCDKHEPFKSPELAPEGCLAELEKKYLEAFSKLPEISKVMQLEYEHEGEVFSRSNVNLARENVLSTMEYLCEFWDGARDADHVKRPESWKCKMCDFKDECKVSPLVAFVAQ